MNRAEICARIPHQGGMCLLERVEHWDESHIVCIAHSHRDRANPLRGAHGLHAVCGVEYAAQTMALHGSLLRPSGDSPPAIGYLASVRDLKIFRERLDDLAHELRIRAERLAGSDDSFIYTFTVEAADDTLLSGRVAVRQLPARGPG